MKRSEILYPLWSFLDYWGPIACLKLRLFQPIANLKYATVPNQNASHDADIDKHTRQHENAGTPLYLVSLPNSDSKSQDSSDSIAYIP